MTFCDDVINGDIIYLMSKHVFIIRAQLCQSFLQLVKAFRFEAKKIPSRVKSKTKGPFRKYVLTQDGRYLEGTRNKIMQFSWVAKHFL